MKEQKEMLLRQKVEHGIDYFTCRKDELKQSDVYYINAMLDYINVLEGSLIRTKKWDLDFSLGFAMRREKALTTGMW